MRIINIYTDGACSNGKKDKWPGGWGAFVTDNDKEVVLQGGADDTTNNEMELIAFREALKYTYSVADKETKATIFTDSAYIYNCFKDEWYRKWQNNGWKTSAKEEVKHKEIWQSILKYYVNIKGVASLEISKVKGHSTDIGNKRADEIAVQMKELFLRSQNEKDIDT